jgi:dimethylargininase
VPAAEPLAGNVLSLGDDVVVPSGYPLTAACLEASGRRVHAVSVGEFEKRDAGVTCLSIVY